MKGRDAMIFRRSYFRTLILLLLAGVIMGGLIPNRQTEAQDAAALGIVDQVLIIVSRNLGIYPAPSRGQLESGTFAFNADIGFELVALDLRTQPLSCTAPELPTDELVSGTVGYVVRVSVQNRLYEYRTNQFGGNMIRCRRGVQTDSLDFGAMPSVGTTISGDAAVLKVIQHLNNYLELDPPMTLEDVNAGNTEYFTSYTWNARVFTNSALNCPAAGATWTEGDMFGYQVTFRVRYNSYRYYLSGDGSMLVLCRGGRADASSIGIGIAPQTDTTGQ